MPIDAFIFGGRRSTTVPLVTEAKSWRDGVYMAATLGSETTAAIVGQVGVVRRDPFAMIAFCGYHIADYVAHWLKLGKSIAKQPKIYLVNWFRKDANGTFVWPGFGDNSRVLKWIVDRLNGHDAATATAIGNVPTTDALDLSGLSLTDEQLELLLTVDNEAWRDEADKIEQDYAKFGDRLPQPLVEQLRELRSRLS